MIEPQLREALQKLSDVLPRAESDLRRAFAAWTPESADALRALSSEVERLRSEHARLTAEIDRLGDG